MSVGKKSDKQSSDAANGQPSQPQTTDGGASNPPPADVRSDVATYADSTNGRDTGYGGNSNPGNDGYNPEQVIHNYHEPRPEIAKRKLRAFDSTFSSQGR